MNPYAIGLQLAPTGIKIVSRALGLEGKPTEYEKELFSMADLLKEKATKPLTDTTEYKSGKRSLEEAQKRNSERAENILGAGNFTNEAKLATMQQSNEALGSGLNQLLANVSRIRDFNQSRYMNTLGAAERARQFRINDFNRNLGSILNPIGEAGNTWGMADLLKDLNTEKPKKEE